MAANKFATLIDRKTNRMTVVLVYAFLEWSLILLIFVNSLLSYLILRFADYFGLKRPCLLCSRLDRFLDGSGKSPSHKDLLCDDHALQIPEKRASLGCAPIEDDLGRFPIGDEAQVHNGFLFLTEQSRSIFAPEEGREEEEEEFSCYVSSFDCNNKVDLDCRLIRQDVREISDLNGDFILDFGADNSLLASPQPDDSAQMHNDDESTDAEVSIGTEIPDHHQIGDIPSSQPIPHHHDQDTLEFKTVEANEDCLLQTGSLHTLHNAMFHLHPTESLDTTECPQGVLTVDKLKLELQEERKAINALYQELEQERSASATAASETMAMINRLHEEKAAMQMEALQYQRMMEEQSEFDQQALHLLNELMVKKEKENAELEKELEKYRKRLDEYEAKMLRMRMRDSSADSYTNNGDSDENNGELLHKNVEGVSDLENTPVDVVHRLDECLDDYQGERLSILGRLKFLEEKLTALNDEEEGKESYGNTNGNGHYHGKETNGKHRVIKSKRLLPLFDAVDGEMENGNHYENGFNESETGEMATVEEEVDELYERLEALEADRDFLRHCVGSLKKGDKGVHLLHEILQHLRDLKNIDLIRIRENEDMSF